MKRALIAVLVFFVANSAIASHVISRRFRSLRSEKIANVVKNSVAIWIETKTSSYLKLLGPVRHPASV